jgi:hypothetical protein
MPKIDQRLNGLNPLSYLGFDAVQPTNIIIKQRDPESHDSRNVHIGSWWLNTATNSLFYLAALEGNVASWINTSSSVGGTQTLTANSGGAVSPLNGNINIVGDGTTAVVIGDPLSHTLIVSAIGSSSLVSLTGNTGGPVFPTANNINLIGSGPLSVAGNPGTSTLTINQSGDVADSFPTDAGTATPSAGVLTINGASNLMTTGVGNTVTVVGPSSLATSFVTNPATGIATPAAGVITFAAGANATVSAAGSTITVGTTGGVPSYSTGTWTPFLSINGNRTGIAYSKQLGIYTQFGAFVYVTANITLTTWPATVNNVLLENLPFTVSNAVSAFQDSQQLNILTPVGSALFTSSRTFYFWVRFTPGTTNGTFMYGGPLLTGGIVQTNNFLSTTSFTFYGMYFM